ncbi:SMI1/KNR4 family protein [Candidatus Odyssella thessalonicensis]|uniref:SMI1/KNR4 family protein n=1 Tax=Candidatus Odyssella thessalonicensis TaxID=84647 RepID=UPI000225ACB0|nr:SMI1/KNR4 family protein [Candidatus Odyssella thessalonicensis]
MEILNTLGPMDQRLLEALEEVWRCSLPKPYRDFILKHNGGLPQPCRFYFKELKDNGSYVDFLFGIRRGFNENLLMNIELYRDRVPNNMIPIGDDPGGNLILISLKGPDRGKVYFWDHEMEADSAQGEVPDYSNLTLIADSFDEFINNLRNDEEVPDNDES